jgi:hypothetical protein
MKASLSPFGRAPHLQVPCSYLKIYHILSGKSEYGQQKWKIKGNEGILEHKYGV